MLLFFDNPATDAKRRNCIQICRRKKVTCYGAYTTTRIQNQDVVSEPSISCVK